MSAQASKPNIKVVQDSLLGAYRMTYGVQAMRKDQFFQICMALDLTSNEILERLKHNQKVLRKIGKWDPNVGCYTGHGLVSMILPRTFNYEKKNDAHPDEPSVKVHQGVMHEGTIDKSIIGSAHHCILQLLHKEYGPEVAALFVDGIQFTTNNWLLMRGFSVGIKDCIIPSHQKEKGQKISDTIQSCYMEADEVKKTTTHKNIRELRVSGALSKAKDVGLRIAKEALDPMNNFLSTVRSGSKGDFFNIAQITGLLGQQNLRGARVPLFLNHGKRSLPHYKFGELTSAQEYESRGFIANSFIHGLNPREFYFHAMAAREGVSDTAMGTATSGYMQRRIVKLLEDVKVAYDGTVRDANNRVLQNMYGGDGYDPVHTVKVNGNQEAVDVGRLIDRLNMSDDSSDEDEE